jgi:hypothetical protein
VNPNLYGDADPDPDPDWHQNDTDPHADPTPRFKHVGESEFFSLLVIALPVYNVFCLSHQCQICHNCPYFGQHIEIFWKKSLVYYGNFFISLELIPIRIGRIRNDMPWMPIPIRIRQYNADPTGSGSTTVSKGIIASKVALISRQKAVFFMIHS